MKTILISGNDTGIGKTWICGALANYLVSQHQRVQIVKVVETGITNEQTGDAETARARASHEKCQAFTLFSFSAPLAPITAARQVGCTLNLKSMIGKINTLPETDWRILETAGGLAVPLEETGLDTVDLALTLPVDYLILVIQNRLGAIHQSRVLAAYAPHEKISTGIWFNDTLPVAEEITHSNYAELANLPLSIWGHQSYQSQALHFFDAFPLPHFLQQAALS